VEELIHKPNAYFIVTQLDLSTLREGFETCYLTDSMISVRCDFPLLKISYTIARQQVGCSNMYRKFHFHSSRYLFSVRLPISWNIWFRCALNLSWNLKIENIQCALLMNKLNSWASQPRFMKSYVGINRMKLKDPLLIYLLQLFKMKLSKTIFDDCRQTWHGGGRNL